MPSYLVQKRIHTLLEYSLFDGARINPFIRNAIRFSPWEQDVDTAWRSRFWLTESLIEADNFPSAWRLFQESLTRVVSRIAFLGQAYHTNLGQPYLIKRTDSNIAYFRHSRDRQPVPLHFDDDDLSSLDILLGDAHVRDSFFLYWNDAINALGYSAKLVLMFAAVEILFEKSSRSTAEYYAVIEAVFGAEHKRELYGTPEDRGRSGLRQRLVHGDYLSENDTKNYVELIHQKIVRYFNAGLLRSHPINEGVVSPQRHLYGNMEGWQGFIRPETDAPLYLKPVQEAFDADDSNPQGYEIVPPNERPDTY